MSMFDLSHFQGNNVLLRQASDTVVQKVVKVKKNERVLIITNPQIDVETISQALYNSVIEVGGIPTLIFQNEKTLLDFEDDAVISALKSEPEVIFSISANKLGKDKNALKNPYHCENGVFTSTFDYLLDGKKVSRAIWTPDITQEIFCRSVCIDYDTLCKNCKIISEILTNATKILVTSPSGTNIEFSVENRKAFCDDGNFSFASSGGNVPSGEVYISPTVGTCEGKIAFDGSIVTLDKTILIKEPIFVELKNGYIESINGKTEAEMLKKTIENAEKQAFNFEEAGKLKKGDGKLYAKNARHIGELGIGLNPAAIITGNMLEDEKAFKTCHFAIGSNYDNDAPSLIHLDGVVKNPTITAFFADGTKKLIEKDGILQIA